MRVGAIAAQTAKVFAGGSSTILVGCVMNETAIAVENDNMKSDACRNLNDDKIVGMMIPTTSQLEAFCHT